MLSIIILSVTVKPLMLGNIVLIAIILSVTNVLSVIKLCVIIVSVVEPRQFVTDEIMKYKHRVEIKETIH